MIELVGFDARQIPGCLAWFRPEVYTDSGGAKVSAWPNVVTDESVNQGTDASRPLVVTDNGRRWFHFTGGAHLTGTEAAVLSELRNTGAPYAWYMIYVVWPQVTTGSQHAVWAAAKQSATYNFTIGSCGAVDRQVVIQDLSAGSGGTNVLSSTAEVATPFVCEVVKPSLNAWQIYANGAEVYNASPGSSVSQDAHDVFGFGIYPHSGSLNASGDYYQRDWILYSSVPGASARQYLRRRLGASIGLSL